MVILLDIHCLLLAVAILVTASLPTGNLKVLSMLCQVKPLSFTHR